MGHRSKGLDPSYTVSSSILKEVHRVREDRSVGGEGGRQGQRLTARVSGRGGETGVATLRDDDATGSHLETAGDQLEATARELQTETGRRVIPLVAEQSFQV